MPGADRGQQAPDRGPVERTIAPVTGPVTEAPETVVDAVGDLIAPKGRSLSSTASVVERVAPAAGALLEQAAPAGQAPVEEVLTPLQNVAGQVPDVAGPLRDVAAPLDDGAQPALTMLSSLPLG